MKITATTKRSGTVDTIVQKLRQAVRDAERWEVAVGYPVGAEGLGTPNPAYAEDGGGEAPSIIEVALKNNYGIGVPRRAFMDLASVAMEDTYKEVIQETAEALSKGEATIKNVLDAAGLKAEDDIRDAIDDGNWLPNSPVTIALKGSDHPLIDTTSMRNRATHLVRPRT